MVKTKITVSVEKPVVNIASLGILVLPVHTFRTNHTCITPRYLNPSEIILTT